MKTKRKFVSHNTFERVISSIVMAAIVLLALKWGVFSSLVLVFLVSILVQDEVLTNFLQYRRSHPVYLLVAAGQIALYYWVHFQTHSFLYLKLFNYIGLLFILWALHYLFRIKMDSKRAIKNLKNHPYLLSGFAFALIMNLATILHFPLWRSYVLILSILVFGGDIGAWFWGKKFGKTKLWPAVSPNKTRTGFWGGLATAVVLASLGWIYLLGDFNLLILISFVFLSGCAQLGDLVQSKLKRQFGIKDSSRLIPGHGGVYDRVDSILFASPLFVLIIRLIG